MVFLNYKQYITYKSQYTSSYCNSISYYLLRYLFAYFTVAQMTPPVEGKLSYKICFIM